MTKKEQLLIAYQAMGKKNSPGFPGRRERETERERGPLSAEMEDQGREKISPFASSTSAFSTSPLYTFNTDPPLVADFRSITTGLRAIRRTTARGASSDGDELRGAFVVEDAKWR